jgi:hypothetical protein
VQAGALRCSAPFRSVKILLRRPCRTSVPALSISGLAAAHLVFSSRASSSANASPKLLHADDPDAGQAHLGVSSSSIGMYQRPQGERHAVPVISMFSSMSDSAHSF